MFDARNRSGDFFPNWSELSLSPVDWRRMGVVMQASVQSMPALLRHRWRCKGLELG